jgi:phospholipid/cholesterol/gamma-HCH transport system substrate-binding protein|tara:strand:- start:10137 stop:11003 length:867 start_codon:yes stop_codon:yes gene_type:complete
LEAKTHYTHVGIAVLLLAVSLLSVSLWLSVGFDRKNYHNYLVYLNEPAGSLTEDSMVKYNGVRVGLVNSIELNQKNPQQVILVLKIDDEIIITEGTQATLISQGITGTTYLGLTATSPSLKPLKKTAGNPYPVIPSKPSFFYQLEKNIDKLTQQVNRVFDKENTDNIRLTLDHLEKLSAVFSKNDTSIDESLQELPKLIKGLKISAQKFDVMADDISVSGKQFTSTMKAGKNSIDQISQQTLPPATLLLRRLNEIAANLEKMSTAMRQNPSIVLRGSAPPKLGPGESL